VISEIRVNPHAPSTVMHMFLAPGTTIFPRMSGPLTVRLVLSRALRRRCPNCGGRPIFVNWWKMLPGCINCGLELERGEPGYLVGAYAFNLGATFLLFAIYLVTTIPLTWPSPPWDLLTWVGAGLMAVFPIFFYPYSKTLYLGVDLLFQPPEE
jgi:uncharacterized protein (DUF983 family)